MKSHNISYVWTICGLNILMALFQGRPYFYCDGASMQKEALSDISEVLNITYLSALELNETMNSSVEFQDDISIEDNKSFHHKDLVLERTSTTAPSASKLNNTRNSSSLPIFEDQLLPTYTTSTYNESFIQKNVINEIIDFNDNLLVQKKQSEIVSLKGKPNAFMAMLKDAQKSDTFEDPFELSAMLHDEASSKNFNSVVRSPEDGMKKFRAAFRPSFQSSGIIPRPQITTQSNFIPHDVTYDNDISLNAPLTPKPSFDNETVPIYEEIRGALHIDTSIDDVEDYSDHVKMTENSDKYIPSINISRTNFLEPNYQRNNSEFIEDRPNHSGETDRFRNQSDQLNSVSNATRNADEAHYFSFFDNQNWGFNPESSFKSSMKRGTQDQMVLEAQAERMLEVMNLTADPCDDFYEYACGRWPDVYPLEDKALDNTFDRLREGLDEVLKTLLEAPITDTDSHSTKIVKTVYKGCMNTDEIERLGSEPLKILLKKLGGWPVLEGSNWNEENFDWVKLMAKLRLYNNDILVSEWVAADVHNSSLHIIQIDQPELGLPSREYFLNPGDEQYREAYLTLMLDACRLLNADMKLAFPEMLNVRDFEKELARILTPAEDRKNLSAVHRRFTVEQLQEEVPEIDWREYLDIISSDSANMTNNVIVFGLKYIKKLVPLIEKTDKRTVANYLIWRFVKNRISNLGKDASNAKQDFIHVLFGSKSQPDRWLSCVSYVNGNLGYIVGALFVKKYYPESSKNDSEEMIQLIRGAFSDALSDAKWMAEGTRRIAIDKVAAMVRNVGYPEYILDEAQMTDIYSQLNFDENKHFDNVIKMLKFHATSTHKLLLKPVNRKEWTTTPAVVNAYYSRSKNMIMFPAGILQPPFYHPAFPRCLNFGGVGVVIGHEISHGFDARGRQFDSNGNLHQWWTTEDVNNFYDRATCMLDQYGNYEVPEVNMKINSVNTLSENIADNAGIKIAFKAYQNWKQIHGDETMKVPKVNLTHDQLFFLNFGQIWCEVNSPEAMFTKLRGGQHSPNKYRVIGTLSNSEEFSQAFNCPAGSPMNPKEKCVVW